MYSSMSPSWVYPEIRKGRIPTEFTRIGWIYLRWVKESYIIENYPDVAFFFFYAQALFLRWFIFGF